MQSTTTANLFFKITKYILCGKTLLKLVTSCKAARAYYTIILIKFLQTIDPILYNQLLDNPKAFHLDEVSSFPLYNIFYFIIKFWVKYILNSHSRRWFQIIIIFFFGEMFQINSQTLENVQFKLWIHYAWCHQWKIRKTKQYSVAWIKTILCWQLDIAITLFCLSIFHSWHHR